MTQKQKRLKRGTYLGGQQMAAVAGMHPYMSVGDVYAFSALGVVSITDESINADPSKANVLRRGMICEAGLVDYIEEHCLKMPAGTLKRDTFVIDPDVPFFAGTIDAHEEDADGKITHIHEVTVTSSRAVDAWGADGDPGGVTKYKWIQNQWYQGISGAVGGTVWLFVSDTGEIRRYPSPRKNKSIDLLRDDGEKFWLDHVIPKVPPPHDCESIGAWAVADDSLTAMFQGPEPGSPDTNKEPTPDLVAAVMAFDKARDDLKDAEERKKGAAAQIKNFLGDNTNSTFDGGRVSWKRNKATTKPDLKAAFDSLAAMHGLDDDTKKEHLDKHDKTKNGPRVLRVTVTKEKEVE